MRGHKPFFLRKYLLDHLRSLHCLLAGLKIINFLFSRWSKRMNLFLRCLEVIDRAFEISWKEKVEFLRGMSMIGRHGW